MKEYRIVMNIIEFDDETQQINEVLNDNLVIGDTLFFDNKDKAIEVMHAVKLAGEVAITLPQVQIKDDIVQSFKVKIVEKED